MAKNYQPLWEGVTSAEDEAGAIRILAEILADKEGRGFISRLERKDAKLCIELLDHVSRDLYSPRPLVVSDGFVRASHNTNSEPPRNRHSSLR